MNCTPSRFRLANGANVVVVCDPNTPAAAVDFRYDIGAKDDPLDRRGLAHFYEHMSFAASGGVAASAIDQIQSWGGNVNGATSYDATQYWCEVPPHKLKEVILLEAERLISPNFSDSDFEQQRDIILAERFEKHELSGDLTAHLPALVYGKDHPYGSPILGTEESISAIEFEDIGRFHENYGTDALSIAIVSPLPVEVVRDMLGELPTFMSRRKPAPTATHYTLPLDTHYTLHLGTDTLLHLVWRTPPSSPTIDPALDFFAFRLRRATKNRSAVAYRARKLGGIVHVAVQLEHHGDQSHLKAKLIECAITTATHSERETFLSDQRLEQAITKSRGGGAAGYTDLLNRAILPASEVERLDLTYSQYLISEPICIQQFPGETRRPRRVPPQRAEAPRQRLPHPDLVQFSLAEPPRQLEDGVFFKRPSAGLKRWGWLATHEPMLEIDLLTASMLREQMSRSFPDCSLEVRVTNGRWLVHLAGAMAVTTNWLDTLESPSLERCDEIRRQLQSRFRKHEPSLLDEFFIAVVGREIQVPNPERLSEAAVDVALQKFNRIVRSRGTQFLIAASPDFPSQQKHKAADLERQPWESGFTSTTHDKPYAEYLLALPMPAGKSSKRDALAIVLNELLGQQQTNYWFQLLRSRGLSYSLTPSLVLDQSVLVLQFVCPQPIADLIPKRYPLGLPDMVSAQNAAAHRLAQKLAHGDPGSWSKFAQNVNWAHDISREIRALNREDVECALSESCKSVRVMARLPAH